MLPITASKWISATSEAVIRRDLAKTWWAPLDAMPFPLRLKCAQKEVVVFYGQSGSAIHGHVALLHIVGLSNICYTVLDEIMECIFWRFPSKRSHWEAVIISIIISFELSSEIFKREETMRGIKAFVILAMTAFYFPIVPWGKGTNLFVLDA